MNNVNLATVDKRLTSNGVDWSVNQKTLKTLYEDRFPLAGLTFHRMAYRDRQPVCDAELRQLRPYWLVYVPGESQKNEQYFKHVTERLQYNGVDSSVNNETLKSLDAAGLDNLSPLVLTAMYKAYLEDHPYVDFKTWLKRRHLLPANTPKHSTNTTRQETNTIILPTIGK
jgi:hypothetical protein